MTNLPEIIRKTISEKDDQLLNLKELNKKMEAQASLLQQELKDVKEVLATKDKVINFYELLLPSRFVSFFFFSVIYGL